MGVLHLLKTGFWSLVVQVRRAAMLVMRVGERYRGRWVWVTSVALCSLRFRFALLRCSAASRWRRAL
jgi:hypothetical protein